MRVPGDGDIIYLDIIYYIILLDDLANNTTRLDGKERELQGTGTGDACARVQREGGRANQGRGAAAGAGGRAAGVEWAGRAAP